MVLQHYVLGHVGLEAELHAALSSGTHIAHGVGYAAGGESHASTKQTLLRHHGLANVGEQCLDGGGGLIGGINRHYETHGRQHGDGSIGYHDKRLRHCVIFSQPSHEATALDTGCHSDDGLP